MLLTGRLPLFPVLFGVAAFGVSEGKQLHRFMERVGGPAGFAGRSAAGVTCDEKARFQRAPSACAMTTRAPLSCLTEKLDIFLDFMLTYLHLGESVNVCGFPDKRGVFS